MRILLTRLDTSPRLAGMIGGLVKHKVVLQGREVIDLAAGVRGVMLGLMDGSVSYASENLFST